MKNGKKAAVFIGLAGIAVVLVALYSTSSPPFSGSDATGAIGAVEKHREEQIAPGDVILADEATHQATQALFADYLDDAAKLENVAVDLQAVLRDGENLEAAGVESLQARLRAIDVQLESHESALAARAVTRARHALVEMRRLLDARKMAGAEVSSLEARLRSAEQELEARKSVDALQASLASLESDFEANALEARRLQNVDANLEAMRRFGSDEVSLEARLRNAQVELESLGEDLEVRSALDARHRWGASAYLEAVAAEQRALQGARRRLSAATASLEARSRAARPQFAELAAVASLMAAEAEGLEARALRNLDAQIEARARYSARLRNLDESLEAISQQFAARRQLSARMPEFDASLSMARRALGSADQALEMRMLRHMDAELNVVASYLDHRARLSARSLGATDTAALQARSNALRARAASTFESYLAAVNRDLGARANAQYANSRSNLASRAESLQSHAAMLAARNRQ